MAVIETVEHTIHDIGRNKMAPVTITRRVGLDTYIDGDEEILADSATFFDYGPKLGITRCYTRHPKVEFTPEQRAEGRRRIEETITREMIRQGIW